MDNPVKKYQENPFFRSTINVVMVQAVFVLLCILVFAASIWFQQRETSKIIDQRRQTLAITGIRPTPESLTVILDDLRNSTLWRALLVLIVLASIFGYFTARYALKPTERSLEFQKRFIGNIAHELRTPLSIIRTTTEVAMMDRTLSEYSRSTFSTTIEELDRISGIINNLLSFDALTRPGNIRFEPLLLTDVAREVVARHREMAQQYGIAIAVDAAETSAYVMGNKIALEQAVTNIVKNALNYTPQHDGRNVIVRIDDHEEEAALSVIDTGIGIAQKDLYYIFQPFYRGDTSRERGIGSGTSGLGLAIVNDIVRAHGGSITIRSALNRGTTIEMSFPKADTRDHVQNVCTVEDQPAEEYEERIG